MFHQLASRYDYIRSLSNTGNQDNLNGALVRSLKVALPPLAEQRAIAEALDDTDALLAALDGLIAKKRDIKHGFAQELLTGRTRLPDSEGAWIDRPLSSDIRSLVAGVSVNSLDDDEPAVHPARPAILKTSAVARGAFIPSESKPIVLNEIGRTKLSPRADTILISRMNTIGLVGECGYVERDFPYHFVPDRLWMARISSGSDALGG